MVGLEGKYKRPVVCRLFRARLVPRAGDKRSRSSPPTSRTRPGRVSLFGDEIEQITEFDPLTGQKTGELKSVKIYANSHYVTPAPDAQPGDQVDQGRAESHRLGRAGEGGAACWRPSGWSSARASTIEMLEATGSCAGIRVTIRAI